MLTVVRLVRSSGVYIDMTTADIDIEKTRIRIPLWLSVSLLASVVTTVWIIAQTSTALKVQLEANTAKLDGIASKVAEVSDMVSRQDERLKAIESHQRHGYKAAETKEEPWTDIGTILSIGL